MNKNMNKKLSISQYIVIIFAFLFIGSPIFATENNITSYSPIHKGGGETVEVIIRLNPLDANNFVSMNKGDKEKTLNTLKVETGSIQNSFIRDMSSNSITIINNFWLANAILAEVKLEDLDEISSHKDVYRVHENFKITTSDSQFNIVSPEESLTKYGEWNTTWGVERIGAPNVWDMGIMGSDSIKVAVLDTGVDMTHPDLEGKMASGGWAEFDSSGNIVTSDPHDTDGHGTHVSGTVLGGNSNESYGYIGVSPNTKLMHGLVLPEGSGTFAQVVAGMQWAVDNNADVVNMSLGAEGYFSDFEEPVKEMINNGIFPVISIGNDGEGSASSPGAIFESFAIGASNDEDGIALFSSGAIVDKNKHEREDIPEEYIKPDFSAPGVSIISAYSGSYASANGTSMAAPHVAGAISLMLQVDSTLSISTIYDALKESADYQNQGDNLGEDKNTRYGYGIINVDKAIRLLKPIFTLPADTDKITHNSASLKGDLTDLNNEGTVEVYFQYREDGETDWIESDKNTVSVDGVYEIEIDSLTPSTLYEFKASADSPTTVEGEVMTFTTESAPLVTTKSAINITTDSATLRGELTDLDGNSEVNVFFNWRENGIGEWQTTSPQLLSATGDFSESITELTENTQYEFKTVVEWEDGGVTKENIGEVVTFFTEDEPEIITKTATDINYSSATLNGELLSLGGETSVDVFFRWRVKGEGTWIETAPEQSLEVIGDFSESVEGLTEDTEYEFKAVVEWEDGEITEENTGEVFSFTTENHPIVISHPADNINYASATLNGELTDMGIEESVEVFFRWRVKGEETWTNESEAEDKTELLETGIFSEELTDLSINTEYEFKAVVEWNSDEEVSAVQEFSTFDTPKTETLSATDVRDTTATLNGELVNIGNENDVKVFFRWKKAVDGEWAETDEIILEEESSFNASISGLETSTEYEFKAVAQWGESDEFEASVNSFTTNIDLALLSPTGLTVSPLETYIERDITISVSVENDTESDESYTVDFEINDVIVESVTKTIQAEQTEEFSITYSNETPGEYVVKVNEETSSFTLYNEPEVVSKEAEVGYETATLKGEVTDLELEDSVTVFFQWRSGDIWSEETTPVTLESAGEFEEEIDNLSIGETYFFRAVIQWEEDGTEQREGSTIEFTTASLPETETLSSENVTHNSATLRGEITEIGVEESVNAFFNWRAKDSEEWEATPTQSLSNTGIFSENISGLSSTTPYEFRAQIEWNSTSDTGDIVEFTTGSAPSTGGGGGGGRRTPVEEEVEEEETEEDVVSETLPEETEELIEHYEERERSVKETLESLESDRSRIDTIKNSATLILNIVTERGVDAHIEVLSTIMERVERIEEMILAEKEKIEEEYAQIVEKVDLSDRYKRLESQENTIKSLISLVENMENRDAEKEILNQILEMNNNLKERIIQRLRN